MYPEARSSPENTCFLRPMPTSNRAVTALRMSVAPALPPGQAVPADDSLLVAPSAHFSVERSTNTEVDYNGFTRPGRGFGLLPVHPPPRRGAASLPCRTRGIAGDFRAGRSRS